jgi:hypothetical protein
MWRDIERLVRLAPVEFRREFDRIYREADDIKTLWQLAGATNDYLRANPGAIDLPIELSRRLLMAEHRDARVIGLKLLNRSSVSDAEIVTAIVRTLKERDAYERCGGLYELGQFLERRRASEIDGLLTAELCGALMPLIRDDSEVHNASSRLLDALTHG